MKHLSKKEIIEVMRYAGNYQREVFQLFDIDVVEVTKYNNRLTVSLHYNPSVVSYRKLCSRFAANFINYNEFIDKDSCYSFIIKGETRSAHFEVTFYA